MPVSESYLSFVLEQLEGVRRVVTKRMFGGVGLYSDSVFFGVIDNDTLFFKTDDILAERYRRLGMPPFAPIPGAKPMAYHQVPPRVLEDAAELTRWAEDSIRVAASSSTMRRRPRRTARPIGHRGRTSVKNEMRSETTTAGTIDAYLKQRSPAVRRMLSDLRATIRKAAPEATEKISYHVPTFSLNGNLVHFAAFDRHIGFYPAPSAIVAFAAVLKRYKTSKGAIQFPLDEPLPLALIAQIVNFRVSENMAKTAKRRPAPRP